MNAKAELTDGDVRPLRRGSRLSLLLDAVLSAAPNPGQPVEVTDISPGGYRARAGAPLEPGAAVTIVLPGLGEVASRVVWVDGQTFGAEFTGPADLRRLFLTRLPAAQPSWMRRAA